MEVTRSHNPRIKKAYILSHSIAWRRWPDQLLELFIQHRDVYETNQSSEKSPKSVSHNVRPYSQRYNPTGSNQAAVQKVHRRGGSRRFCAFSTTDHNQSRRDGALFPQLDWLHPIAILVAVGLGVKRSITSQPRKSDSAHEHTKKRQIADRVPDYISRLRA